MSRSSFHYTFNVSLSLSLSHSVSISSFFLLISRSYNTLKYTHKFFGLQIIRNEYNTKISPTPRNLFGIFAAHFCILNRCTSGMKWLGYITVLKMLFCELVQRNLLYLYTDTVYACFCHILCFTLPCSVHVQMLCFSSNNKFSIYIFINAYRSNYL